MIMSRPMSDQRLEAYLKLILMGQHDVLLALQSMATALLGDAKKLKDLTTHIEASTARLKAAVDSQKEG